MTLIANHAHLTPPPRPGDWWPEGGVTTLLKHLDACQVENDQALILGGNMARLLGFELER